MIIKRKIHDELLMLGREYPIVTILGPRQAGKTTLIRQSFPDKPYVNLEDPQTRALAADDPKGFLAQFPNGALWMKFSGNPNYYLTCK